MNDSKVCPSKFITLLLAYSGLLIYFAFDACFNMMVLIPVMLIVLLWYMKKCSLRIPVTENLKISFYIIEVYIVAIVTNFILNYEIINTKSFIRLGYSALIVIYFSIITNIRFSKNDIIFVLSGNIFSSFVTALLIIKNWLNGAKGKISIISFFGKEIEENYTGAILAFGFSIGIFMLICLNKNNFYKLLLIIFEIIIVFGLFLTGSRAAFLGMCLSLGSYILIYIFKSESKLYKSLFSIYFFTSNL